MKNTKLTNLNLNAAQKAALAAAVAEAPALKYVDVEFHADTIDEIIENLDLNDLAAIVANRLNQHIEDQTQHDFADTIKEAEAINPTAADMALRDYHETPEEYGANFARRYFKLHADTIKALAEDIAEGLASAYSRDTYTVHDMLHKVSLCKRSLRAHISAAFRRYKPGFYALPYERSQEVKDMKRQVLQAYADAIPSMEAAAGLR